MRCCTSIYRFGWQDNELPDRCVRRLCVRSRSCLYRSSPVLAQELDWRSGKACSSSCSSGYSLRYQARPGCRHDTACAGSRCAVFMGGRRCGLWRRGQSKEPCAEPAKATFLGLNRTTISARGRESLRSPAQRRRSPVISIQVHGNVFLPVRAPKALGFMTGPTANSPISMPTNTTKRIGALDPWPPDPTQYPATVISHSSPHGARPGRTSRRSFPLKAIAGPSKTASRPPRTSSDSITTKPGHGMAGIATSPSSCSPSP